MATRPAAAPGVRTDGSTIGPSRSLGHAFINDADGGINDADEGINDADEGINDADEGSPLAGPWLRMDCPRSLPGSAAGADRGSRRLRRARVRLIDATTVFKVKPVSSGEQTGTKAGQL